MAKFILPLEFLHRLFDFFLKMLSIYFIFSMIRKLSLRYSKFGIPFISHLLSAIIFLLESRQPPNQTQLPPIRVCALRSNRNDSDVHVMLLDPEALICQLLAEDAEAASTHGKPVNPKRHPSRGLSQIPVQDQRKSIKTSMTSQIQREVGDLFPSICGCVNQPRDSGVNV